MADSCRVMLACVGRCEPTQPDIVGRQGDRKPPRDIIRKWKTMCLVRPIVGCTDCVVKYRGLYYFYYRLHVGCRALWRPVRRQLSKTTADMARHWWPAMSTVSVGTCAPALTVDCEDQTACLSNHGTQDRCVWRQVVKSAPKWLQCALR